MKKIILILSLIVVFTSILAASNVFAEGKENEHCVISVQRLAQLDKMPTKYSKSSYLHEESLATMVYSTDLSKYLQTRTIHAVNVSGTVYIDMSAAISFFNITDDKIHEIAGQDNYFRASYGAGEFVSDDYIPLRKVAEELGYKVKYDLLEFPTSVIAIDISK